MPSVRPKLYSRPGPAPRHEPLEQAISHHEVGHVIQSEGAFQAVWGELPGAEHGARVVDEHINARLCLGDIQRNLFHLADQREVREADAVSNTGARSRSRFMASSPRARSRAIWMMCAPILARSSPAACPMPEVAPVMTTTLPVMSLVMVIKNTAVRP